MNEPVTTKYTSAGDISRIVEGIYERYSEETPEALMMSCIATAILLQDENITLDQLRDGVMGASEWIALYISSLDDKAKGNLEPSKVN